MNTRKIIRSEPSPDSTIKRYSTKPFYTLIINRNTEDHHHLRTALNEMIPNVLIESLYDEEETIAYFENCKNKPDLIFLDMNMHTIFLKFALYTIRKTQLLCSVPVAIVNSSLNIKNREELKAFGVSEFYLELKRKLELRLISYDVKKRWLVV